jgi:hypothetical protein
MIHFNQLTIPTPQPFERSAPSQQQENFFYVLNQILGQLKANNETKELNPTATQTVNVDLADLTQAVKDLAFNGQMLDLSGLIPGLALQIRLTNHSLTLADR